MKRYSIALGIRELQIKALMRCHYVPITLTKTAGDAPVNLLEKLRQDDHTCMSNLGNLVSFKIK